MTRKFFKKIPKKIIRERGEAIAEAIKRGYTTESKISRATGLSIHEVSECFKWNIPLYQKYTYARKTIVDKASDSVEDIIDDPSHPNHYQASIYILKTYKSDLDEILESHDKESVIVGVGGDEKTKVNITFK